MRFGGVPVSQINDEFARRSRAKTEAILCPICVHTSEDYD